MVPVVCTLMTGMSILCFYCYFGAQATKSFQQMADSLYASNWPDLPVALQKYVIVMIANMQKPLYYHGFNMINLDLKTFIAVS